MKLKHWMMESLSRARKKSKNDHPGSRDANTKQQPPAPETTTLSRNKEFTATDKTPASRGGRRLSVKEIIMPLHNAPRERKYVRDNYPAVAAYLDHQRQPLSNVGNLRSFRPIPAPVPQPPVREASFRGYERLYANLSPETTYAVPSTLGASSRDCGCYRHDSEAEKRSCNNSENSMDMSSSVSGTLNSRRVNIRTNPWIAPNAGETGSFHPACQQPKTSITGKGAARAPVPPPKPQRKRPPPAVVPAKLVQYEEEEAEEDAEMVVCSDKNVGTDGDEYLFEESSSCCDDDCEDCCSSSCTSFSSLKFSSGPFFSTDTIQACDSDTCSVTSTPTILNDFDDADAENSTDRDSAVDSPGSRQLQVPVLKNSSSGGSSRRVSHYSPADSHTSWKYFDDDDEVDSGHGQTASSLGSPGSAGDFSSRHISHSNSTQSAASSKRMFVEDDTREEFVDIDTNIEIIRSRLQKQVYQLKHEQTALDWRMLRSMGSPQYGRGDTETMIEEDFIVQKKAILAETLDLLKRQLEEQNYRLQSSHLALQNLQQRRQGKRHEPRNRDCRALSALYNENIRETFC